MSSAEGRSKVHWSGLVGLDLAKEVTTGQTANWTETPWVWNEGYGVGDGAAMNIVVVDYGIKRTSSGLLAGLGAKITIVPATAWQTILAQAGRHLPIERSGRPGGDGQLCGSRHPGAACDRHPDSASAWDTDAGAGARRPHREDASGHHGANHPVKDHTTGKVEIVSMNHGFAADGRRCPMA